MKYQRANKALHWTPIPLRSIGASELDRSVLQNMTNCQLN